jgi:hypothetical protein
MFGFSIGANTLGLGEFTEPNRPVCGDAISVIIGNGVEPIIIYIAVGNSVFLRERCLNFFIFFSKRYVFKKVDGFHGILTNYCIACL